MLDAVRARGALRADELPHLPGAPRALEHSWFGSVRRAVLEAHFGRGALAVATREADFARRYDLAERVVPAEHHARTVERAEAQRQLLLQAARAHGVGTLADLADYFRMPVRDPRPRLEELLHPEISAVERASHDGPLHRRIERGERSHVVRR